MAIFCPDCGKENADDAKQCESCDREIKPGERPGRRFKGTMMMTNVMLPNLGTPEGTETDAEDAKDDLPPAQTSEPPVPRRPTPPPPPVSPGARARQKTMVMGSSPTRDRPASAPPAEPVAPPAGAPASERPRSEDPSHQLYVSAGPPPDATEGSVPSDPGSEPPPPPKRTGLFVALGCLGVVLLSCGLLTWWLQAYGLQWMASQGGAMAAEASRVVLVEGLNTVQQHCQDGKVGGDGRQWFSADASEGTRAVACDLSRSEVAQLSDPNQTKITSLAELTDDVSSRFEVDPRYCYQYAATATTTVACFDLESGDQIPYKILEIRRSDTPSPTAGPDETQP